MDIEILYDGQIVADVVEHRKEGNVLSLTLVNFDGASQTGFLDIENVRAIYHYFGDLIIAYNAEREKAREKRFQEFMNYETANDSDY